MQMDVPNPQIESPDLQYRVLYLLIISLLLAMALSTFVTSWILRNRQKTTDTFQYRP